MGVFRFKDNGKEPNTWKVEHVADVGASEEFVKQLLELQPIVEAGTIFEPKRAQVKEAVGTVLVDGLMPAFLELKDIRASVLQKMPLMNREQLYEDFARKLWKAYKDLMQQAIRLMDFELGFLFQKDRTFKEGLKRFRELNPRVRPGFEQLLQWTRDNWQNDLGKFRNTYLEHKTSDRGAYEIFYKPENSEILFDNVWRTIVDILAMLLEARLQEGWVLIERPPDDPGPPWGQRFRYQNTRIENGREMLMMKTIPPGALSPK